MAENDAFGMLDSIAYYEDGEVIFDEGSSGDEMYVIHSGKVELSRTVDNEKETLAVLGKDSFFGEMALLRAHRKQKANRSTFHVDIYLDS